MIDLSFLTIRNILIWVGAWSLLGVFLMGFDKVQAVDRQERISEKTLHEVAFMGGFPGIILGAKVFHHKTSKRSFWPMIVAAVSFWVVLLGLLVKNGVLQFSG